MPLLSRRRALTSLSAAVLTARRAAAQTQRPNILYIMSDDHASHAISAYGSRINQTANIDRIAKEGVRMENCFCTNSICTPSRAAILTGQYSHKNGVYTLADPIDPARNHVAKELQKGGYQTAMIGKWHLATNPTGFDFWRILPGQGAYYDPVFLHQDGSRKKHEGYCTDLIGDFTLDWLKNRNPAKPFFLMSHHKAPHRAWQPAPKYQDWLKDVTIPEPDNLYDNWNGKAETVRNLRMRVGQDSTKTDLKVDPPLGLEGDALRKWAYQLYIKDYLRCVRSVDDNVGRVLDFLDNNNLRENTLIMYSSDQGFFLGDHGWYDKRMMYEEALRMPFLARLPGAIPAGSVRREMLLNIDFAPTFLDFAGLAKAPEMQGESARTVLGGKAPRNWRKSMYYRYWMHNDGSHRVPAHYGIRTDRYKLIYFYNKALGMKGAHPPDTSPEWEFYDLQADPREMRNAIDEKKYAKTIANLKQELAKLQSKYEDTPVG
ncbi:MAG: sulfatase [Bryobacter sp.]|nr:sulfatase [Bryobacter sp.]